MKVVVVKFINSERPSLVPLIVDDSTSLTDLLADWRSASSVSEELIELQTISGDALSLEKTVADLPWIANHSSVEIVARPFQALSIAVGGLDEALSLRASASSTFAEIARLTRAALELDEERQLEFRDCDGEVVPEDRSLSSARPPLSVELKFFVRVFEANGEDFVDVERSGSQTLGSLVAAGTEIRLVWHREGGVVAKLRRSLVAGLGMKAGATSEAPAEVRKQWKVPMIRVKVRFEKESKESKEVRAFTLLWMIRTDYCEYARANFLDF